MTNKEFIEALSELPKNFNIYIDGKSINEILYNLSKETITIKLKDDDNKNN